MSSLEKIIRPFQTGNAVRPRQIPTEQSTKADPVRFQAGRNGGGKQFNGNGSETISLYCEAHQVETRNDESPRQGSATFPP